MTPIRFLLGLCLASAVQAHEPGVTWSDDREMASLAANIDKAVQACGVHASEADPKALENRSKLTSRGVRLEDETPGELVPLARAFGEARFSRWPDPHAEIWLITANSKPGCRIAVSHSKWVSKIDQKLSELIQVGNYWKPATPEQNILGNSMPGGPSNTVYVMDSAGRPVVPTLIITKASDGALLTADQQMILTVLMMSRN